MDIQQNIKNTGLDVLECEKVVGNEANVTKLANFFEKNAALFHLITADCLLDYAMENEYTKDEMVAYRFGLGEVGKFMQKCLEEREQRSQPVPKD